MENIPSPEELYTYYSRYEYGSERYLSPLTIKSWNLLLDEFEKYRNTNKLLDVGCGRGQFLEQAKKRGWEVYGTEYSEKALEICQQKGITMQAGQLKAALYTEKDFDVITSFEVMEHINNPHKDLKEINHLLRRGGLFYCTTPNFNSLLRYYLKADYNIIEYPEHLLYYTKATLNKIVSEHNFKPIKFLSTGISLNQRTSTKVQAIEEKLSKDEILRENIDSKWYLTLAKALVNKIFTLTNLGITLKGYYTKP